VGLVDEVADELARGVDDACVVAELEGGAYDG